jgi:hypothetical protein
MCFSKVLAKETLACLGIGTIVGKEEQSPGDYQHGS